MDEKIEKALSVANYMATLSNQRRIIFEEFNQKQVYYTNGGTFNVDHTLITFVKNAIDLGYTENVPFLDANHTPIIVSNVQDFFDNIVSTYFEALNEYASKYADIKSKRRIGDIVKL